jgi:mycofactocin precursor
MRSTFEEARAAATTRQDPAHDAAAGDPASRPAEAQTEDPLVVAELLVEDVSIDGMCGVY